MRHRISAQRCARAHRQHRVFWHPYSESLVLPLRVLRYASESVSIARLSPCPISAVGLPLRYASVAGVPLIAPAANLSGSRRTHWMRMHQSSIVSMPSFAFPHAVDSPDYLAMKDPLDVGPLSRPVDEDSYPRHYSGAFASSNLSNPHCHQCRFTSTCPAVAGTIRGFHVPLNELVGLGASSRPGSAWTTSAYFLTELPLPIPFGQASINHFRLFVLTAFITDLHRFAMPTI